MHRRSIRVSLVARSVLVAACAGSGAPAGPTPDAGAATGPASAVAPVLSGLAGPVEPAPWPAALVPRTASYGLGTVTLADGVPAPLRGVVTWPISVPGAAPVPLELLAPDAGALQIVSLGVDRRAGSSLPSLSGRAPLGSRRAEVRRDPRPPSWSHGGRPV